MLPTQDPHDRRLVIDYSLRQANLFEQSDCHAFDV
jgi:hypothetical protein